MAIDPATGLDDGVLNAPAAETTLPPANDTAQAQTVAQDTPPAETPVNGQTPSPAETAAVDATTADAPDGNTGGATQNNNIVSDIPVEVLGMDLGGDTMINSGGRDSGESNSNDDSQRYSSSDATTLGQNEQNYVEEASPGDNEDDKTAANTGVEAPVVEAVPIVEEPAMPMTNGIDNTIAENIDGMLKSGKDEAPAVAVAAASNEQSFSEGCDSDKITTAAAPGETANTTVAQTQGMENPGSDHQELAALNNGQDVGFSGQTVSGQSVGAVGAGGVDEARGVA